MQIVRVAIWLPVQESYGLGVKTVEKEGTEHPPPLNPLIIDVSIARHDSNTIIKFAADTTVVGLITDNDETAYREEARDLAGSHFIRP